MPHQRDGLTLIAGVEVHLTAAGLFEREIDRVAQPLQQPHHRTPGLGENRIVETGDEQ
jgi:hypothetical protein